MTLNGVGYFFGYDVVGKQEIVPISATQVDIEDILTIGRLDAFLIFQVRYITLKELEAPLSQDIATGKNYPLIFRELNAGYGNVVDPHDLMRNAVEDQVAGVLIEGNHPQQNQVADLSIAYLSIIQSLTLLHHVFGVNPLSVGGIVLYFDRQITTDHFHKEAIFDVDMGVIPSNIVLRANIRPREVICPWKDIGLLTKLILIGRGGHTIKIPSEYLLKKARLKYVN